MPKRLKWIALWLVLLAPPAIGQTGEEYGELRPGEVYYFGADVGRLTDGSFEITKLHDYGPARRFGLRVGDRIVRIGGTRLIRGRYDFHSEVRRHAGESFGWLLLRIVRDAEERSRVIVLDARSDAASGGKLRRLKFDPLVAYIGQATTVITSYERQYQNIEIETRGMSAREGKQYIARLLREWQDGMEAVDTDPTPIDVRRTHAAVAHQIGRMALVAESGSRDTELTIRLADQAFLDFAKAHGEWGQVVKLANAERVRKARLREVATD